MRPRRVWLAVLLLLVVENVCAWEPPRMQVRYNSSFLDVPLGYRPYPFRTQIWYRHLKICSDLIIYMNLTNMGQGDGAVVVEISNCYMCDGVSIRIQGWGDGTYGYDAPASFSRPVHVNISNNVMNSVLQPGAIHLIGTFPARSTIVISNNSFLQSFTSSSNSYSQSFVLLEGVWLRHKTQFIVENNTIQCTLPMAATDPISTCVGMLIKEGLRVDDATQVTFTQNIVQLGAHVMLGIYVAISDSVGAALRLTRFSTLIVSRNVFDLASYPALLPSNSPAGAVAVLIDADHLEVSQVSSLLSMENTYQTPSASGAGAGWYIANSGVTGNCAVVVSARSVILFSAEAIELGGAGAGSLDSLLALSTVSTLTITDHAAVVVESSTLTVSAAAPGGGSKSLIALGCVLTIDATSAMWLDANSAVFDVAGPTTSYVLLNVARLATSTVVAAADGFVAKGNTCTNCGAFYMGGLGSGASATIDALTERCNVLNGVGTSAATATQLTVTALTSHVCDGTCIGEVDCFSPNTVFPVGASCECTCTAASAALPHYGGHCLPGGLAMSLPLLYSSTMTLTQSDSVSRSPTERNTSTSSLQHTDSLSDEPSSSASISASSVASSSLTGSPSADRSLSRTVTMTESPSVTPTDTSSVSTSDERSRTRTLSHSLSLTSSSEVTPTTSVTHDYTSSASFSRSASETQTSTSSVSPSTSATSTAEFTNSESSSTTPSQSVSPSVTNEVSKTTTHTAQQTLTETVTFSITSSFNVTVTQTMSGGTPSGTSDQTLTETEGSFTELRSVSITEERTASNSKSLTPTENVTVSISHWLTPTRQSVTRSHTVSSEDTETRSLSEGRSPTFETVTAGSSQTRTNSLSLTTTASETVWGSITVTTTPSKSPSPQRTRSPTGRTRSGTITEWVSRSTTITLSVSPTKDVTASRTNSTPPSVSPSATASSEPTSAVTTSETTTATSTRTPRGDTATLHPTNSPSRPSASITGGASLSLTVSWTTTVSLPPRSRSAQPSGSDSSTVSAFTATRILTPTHSSEGSFSAPIRPSASMPTMTSHTVTLTDVSHSLDVTASVQGENTATNTITLTLPRSTASTTGDYTSTETISTSSSDPGSATVGTLTANETVTETGTELRSLTPTASSSPTSSTSAIQTSSRDVTGESSTAEQTATITETLRITLSSSRSSEPASGTVTLSPDSRTLLFSDSMTKSDSIASKGLRAQRLGAGAQLTWTLTSSLTPSLGSNALVGRTGAYHALSSSITVAQSPSPTATWSQRTYTSQWTLSASSDLTLTETKSLTPPPTPSRTVTPSQPPYVPGNFAAFFNIFFVSNVSFNDCTWSATFIIGPILLLVVLAAIASFLWNWGCCEVCFATRPEEGQVEVSVLRSLFALTTFASVLRPCHMSCWFLHVAHFSLHAVVLLMLFLWLAHWLGVSSGSIDVALIAFVIGISVCAAQFTRPIYIYLSYRYSWDPVLMESAWRDLVNSDERYRMYRGSSDDEDDRPPTPTSGAVEGVVVDATPSRASLDAVEGFAPLYDGEDIYDDISSSTGSDISDVAAGEDAFQVTETNLDQIIQFHMDAPKANAAQLYQTFRREQLERRTKQGQIDYESEAASRAADNPEEVEREAARRMSRGAQPLDAMAAAALKLRRKAKKASKQVRARRGSSSVAFDIVVEDDVDIDGLIGQYQSFNGPPPLPESGVTKTHQELRDIREGRNRSGSVVDTLIEQHLHGVAEEDIDGSAFENRDDTIQAVMRRKKHRDARRVRSAEQAVVENLLDQHQRGMELLAIDAEVSLLPEVDFLAEEAFDHDRGRPLGEEGRLKPPPNADEIRERVRGIVGAKSILRAPSRERKTEADLLIEAHLHGESLEALDTIEDRELRRQQRLQEQVAPLDPAAQDVSDLLTAFASGNVPQDEEQRTHNAKELHAGDLMNAFLSDPHAFSNEMERPARSNDAAVAVDAILSSHLYAPPAPPPAEVPPQEKSDIEDLIAAHLHGIMHHTEESEHVDELMQSQLVQDRIASEQAKKARMEQTKLAEEIDDLMSVHMGVQKEQDRRQAGIEDDVDNVLSYFTGGGTEPTLPPSVKRERRSKGKRKSRRTKAKNPVVPAIAVTSAASDDEGDGAEDMIRPSVPRLHGLAPVQFAAPAEDGVSPRPMMSQVVEQVSKGLLHASSPFASRRLALETPRTSPSATPRIQHHSDVFSGMSSDGSAASPAHERHFISASVELLPDDEALTPQPRQGPSPTDSPPKGVDDWIVLRRTGEGYDDVEDNPSPMDAETLLAEDNALIRHECGDIDVDGQDDLFHRPLSTEESNPRTGTVESHTFTLISTLFASSDESETGSTKSAESKKKKRGTRKKKRRQPSLPRRGSRPDEDYRTLHAAFSPVSEDENASERPDTGATETGSRPILGAKTSLLSLRVLDNAVAPPPAESLLDNVDGIEIPSLNSSLVESITGPTGDDDSGTLAKVGPQQSDEGDTETNSSVDHMFEKHCSVRVSGEAEEIFVDLPVTTHHGATGCILLLLLALSLFCLYRVLTAIGDAPMCSDLRWEVLFVLFLVDAFLADPLSMAVAYCFRYIRSDERNSIWKELHPYHGELRPMQLPPLRSKYIGSGDEVGEPTSVEPFDKTTPIEGGTSTDGSHSSVGSFHDILNLDRQP